MSPLSFCWRTRTEPTHFHRSLLSLLLSKPSGVIIVLKDVFYTKFPYALSFGGRFWAAKGTFKYIIIFHDRKIKTKGNNLGKRFQGKLDECRKGGHYYPDEDGMNYVNGLHVPNCAHYPFILSRQVKGLACVQCIAMNVKKTKKNIATSKKKKPLPPWLGFGLLQIRIHDRIIIIIMIFLSHYTCFTPSSSLFGLAENGKGTIQRIWREHIASTLSFMSLFLACVGKCRGKVGRETSRR